MIDKLIRVIQPVVDPDRRRRPSPILCGVTGCFKTTKNHKPFCKDHLSHDPYIAAIIKEARRQRLALNRKKKKKSQAKLAIKSSSS